MSLAIASAICAYAQEDRQQSSSIRERLDTIKQKKIMSDLLLAQTVLNATLAERLPFFLIISDEITVLTNR